MFYCPLSGSSRTVGSVNLVLSNGQYIAKVIPLLSEQVHQSRSRYRPFDARGAGVVGVETTSHGCIITSAKSYHHQHYTDTRARARAFRSSLFLDALCVRC